jgi:dTDP-glucose 4,6-dehydratase
MKNILVTGGCGFIGSNFIRYIFGGTEQDGGAPRFPGRVVNLDKLTYAGNPVNLADIETRFGTEGAGPENGRYVFVRGDICDTALADSLFTEYNIDTVIHFAAESHVDRSIHGPAEFIRTNINGTFTLLEAARKHWQRDGGGAETCLFHHVSTDEVYGSLGAEGYFSETTPYGPRSPYSASKASSDHLVMSYYHTYGLPITMSNCSNNYGPYQFPEKLIPLMIFNMLDGKPLPVYGDGKNIRDWLHVEDHNSAVWRIVESGCRGECYNIGGENEWENLTLVHVLCEKAAGLTGKEKDYYKKLITFVPDRPGHDRRYAINCDKLKNELAWTRRYTFDEGLEQTVRWYLENRKWAEGVRTGAYKEWIERNYGGRG